jgi:hypothetical protein
MSDKRMGALFDQSRYAPLPQSDPREDMRRLDRLRMEIYPEEKLAREAGIDDIGRYPVYGPPNPELHPGTDAGMERAQGLTRYPVINRMVSPERFHDALTRMPESPNAVWSFDDRFRGM